MIRIIGSDIRANSWRVKLPVTVLLGLFFTLASRPQSQTKKPSDVFFGDPSDLQIAEEKVGLTSIGQEVGKNYLSSHSIIAKDVVLRGWLAWDGGVGGGCSQASSAVSVNCIEPGISDVHYELVLDYDFISSTYGTNAGVLNGATLHGHGPHTWDSQATPIPMKNPLANTVSGIDINSFWSPISVGLPSLIFHTELNAWHPNSSYRNCQWVAGNPMFCSTHNFEGRGPAPVGWVEKDYKPVEANSSQNWWPFDPDNPDGLMQTGPSTLQPGPNHQQYLSCFQNCDCAPDARGKPNAACMNACNKKCEKTPNAFISVPTTVPNNVEVGNYVEMRGTLWQDIYHEGPPPPDQYCWNVGPYQNQGGHLEIHPVDSLKRLPPTPSPLQFDKNGIPTPSRDAAEKGAKRLIAVALCADAQGASNGAYISSSGAFCPDRNYDLDDANLHTRTPQPLVPHFARIIDGRFTNAAGLGAATTHKVDAVADCVYIQDYWPPGLKSAYYKATYVVWWTPPPLTGPRIGNAGLAGGPISNTGNIQLIPSLSATVCPTVDGKSCISITARPPNAPLMDIVTVTSSGAPMAGATVTVSGQPTNTVLTNANGVAVTTHLPCYAYAPGAPVPQPGQAQPGRRPVACQATTSMAGYQPYSFTLP